MTESWPKRARTSASTVGRTAPSNRQATTGGQSDTAMGVAAACIERSDTTCRVRDAVYHQDSATTASRTLTRHAATSAVRGRSSAAGSGWLMARPSSADRRRAD